MRKNYYRLKRVATVLTVFITVSVFAQNDNEFTDVIIDGKPAKLSMTTGEYKFVEEAVKTVVTPIKEEAVPISEHNTLHTVKKGETFYAISKQYGISIAYIKELNTIKTNTLKIGQTLKIGYVKRSTETDTKQAKHWVVKKGETLYSIGKTNGITVGELKRLNNLQSNLIKVGSQLILK